MEDRARKAEEEMRLREASQKIRHNKKQRIPKQESHAAKSACTADLADIMSPTAASRAHRGRPPEDTACEHVGERKGQ
ncbi:hypothetical protein BLNAU_16367 [Blattamonas nauphoetae]|uniref:Uncharacterized protein n=1 Tax=Blattamonas nauphoetae TaxID=2049346 RepID=A0ABQ9XCY7_9EUKA|nr:hypothetical protein BLNAU_16367 [Blattamonas nauphoetae]